MINILLTSAGGLTGIFLSKHLSSRKDINIIAIDISAINPLKKWVKKFYTVPLIEDKNYLNSIKEIVTNEKIDIIIPITSYDVKFYSDKKIRANLGPTKLLLVDEDMDKILSEKDRCYKYLNSIDIKTPKIYLNIKEVKYPLIMKPIRGSGSKNVNLIQGAEELEYWSKRNSNFILVEYINGKEFTVDCLFDNDGVCYGANVRERIKMNGGGAVVTKNNYDINIQPVLQKLEKSKKIKGPVNFQFKLTENNDLIIFDFNTRFASGGLALSVKSGFDIPNVLVDYLSGKEIAKWHPSPENNNLYLIKYFEEFYTN